MTQEDMVKAEQIVGRWFWQPDSWRSRSLVRFYESAPMESDVMKLIIEYLQQQTVSEITVLNHKYTFGETWKATDAWYQTVPSDKWNGTDSAKVRIYQAMAPSSDGSQGPLTVDNGCFYRVEHTFYWDVSQIPSVPQSSSGVSYSLQGVIRDKETKLFSCVLVKRTRIQQNVASYATSKTAFENRAEQSHLGVNQSSVKTTGLPASVDKGKIVKRKITKNEDCTSDIHNETIEERPVTSAVEYRKTVRGSMVINTKRSQTNPLNSSGMVVGETRRSELTEGELWDNTVQIPADQDVGEVSSSCDKTAFDHTDTTTVVQADVPRDKEVGDPGNGKSSKRSVRLTESGVEVEDVVRKENRVVDAVVSAKRTMRAIVVTRQSRSVPAPLDNVGLEIGEERRSELTPGCLYNTTVSKTISSPAGTLSKECSKDAFSERDSSMINVGEIPDDIHVDPAAGGVTHSRTVRMTDENTVDVVDVTTKEFNVPKSSVVIEKTLRGVRTTTIDKSQIARLDSSDMLVGDVRRSEMTSGGLFNNQNTTFVHAQNNDPVSTSCVKSIFDETDETKKVVSVMPEEHVDDAGSGKMYRRVAQKNEDSTVDVTDTIKKLTARSWETPKVETNFIYRRQWNFRNFTKNKVRDLITSAAAFLDGEVCAWVNEGRPPSSHDVSPQVQLNEGGRYDGSVSIGANWSITSAGMNGEKECVYYKYTFSYYSFDPWSSRNFTSGSGPVVQPGWNGTWHGAKYTVLRAAGRGRNSLSAVSGVTAIARAPQISYNPANEEWELEVITHVVPISNISSSKINVTLPQEKDRAPAGTGGAEPSISDTEWSE